MSDKLRYSDDSLAEFRSLIDEKISNAEKDLKHFQGQIDYSGNNSGDETGKKLGSLEDGSEALGREKIAQLAHRQRKFIQQLKAAIVRIENKTYGVCRQTGKLISKQRLNIVPHTTLSIEAKNAQQQEY